MPGCLPPLLARAAEDEDEGLPALHGSSSRAVFPELDQVSALIDLSGKRWAHTAVIRLPFPDVEAVSQFVRQQLSGEDSGCHLSTEERSRNEVQPSWLLLSAFHPLAPRLLDGTPAAQAEAAAAGPGSTAAGVAVGSGGSILSLLPAAEATSVAVAATAGSDDGLAVLRLAIDLTGRHTPPFSPGLLPGVRGGGEVGLGGAIGQAVALQGLGISLAAPTACAS